MDPVGAPLFSAMMLTASALAGLGEHQLPDALRGLIGNLAAGSIDTTARRLLARLADQSTDASTGLPRNHDVARASEDALRGAVMALILEVDSE